LEKLKKNIRKKIDYHIEKLENLGIDDITKKEEYFAFGILIVFHLLLYLFLFLIIPIKSISIPLISALFIISVIFVWLDYKDEYGDYEDTLSLFGLGITIIPLTIIVYYLLMKFVPYRGNNKMRIRQAKLKMLIRKSRINKLKFWK